MGPLAMADNAQSFTEDELKALHALAEKGRQLLEMESSYSFYGRVGRLFWKIGVTIGATIGALTVFKDQVISLFKWG